MTDDLRSLLDHLHVLLVSQGATIVKLMGPGVDAEHVRVQLAECGLTPTAEVVEWFGWHNGAGEFGAALPRESIDLVPGGQFYWLNYLTGQYRQTVDVAREVASSGPTSPTIAEDIWRRTWFPLLEMFGKGYVVADLAGGLRDESPVYVVWHDSGFDERARVAWPSIRSFVAEVVSRFESGQYWIDEHGYVTGEHIDFPESQQS